MKILVDTFYNDTIDLYAERVKRGPDGYVEWVWRMREPVSPVSRGTYPVEHFNHQKDLGEKP